jgi:hypothetical protein
MLTVRAPYDLVHSRGNFAAFLGGRRVLEPAGTPTGRH